VEDSAGGEDLVLDPADLAPSLEDIEVFMGYPAGAMPAAFCDMAEAARRHASACARPLAAYRIHPIDSRGPGRLSLGGAELSLGDIVAGELKNACAAAAFVCTIGPGPEALAGERMRADAAPAAYAADAVASLMAEKAAEALHAAVARASAGRGWGCGERYSPGYCGWPVSDQVRLFSLLPAGACGVSLSPSSLMSPLKSVSGLIGLGQDMRRTGYRCGECGRLDCPSRGRGPAV